MNYFDLHCDTMGELSPFPIYGSHGTLKQNSGQLDLQRAARFDRFAQVFALYCGAKPLDDKAYAHERFVGLLQTAENTFEQCADVLYRCRTAEDFLRAEREHKAAAFLSIEGAELLQSAEDIQTALDAGVRIVTLAWNHRSVYACGASTDNNAGLTAAGVKFARYLSDHEVFLDVSHLSERGFWELAETISAPILATHSNSKAICPHARNLTDEQFLEIARRGGRIGINFYVPFVTQKQTASCEDVLRHIEHFCALGGEKILCIGADWDGCDRMPEGISDVTGVERLAETLARHGYAEKQISALFYDNAKQFVLSNF